MIQEFLEHYFSVRHNTCKECKLRHKSKNKLKLDYNRSCKSEYVVLNNWSPSS